MSKERGEKVVIKFTEDLIGSIGGNESAFTITGKQRKHINGVLINGDYQIEKIERYPIPKIWEENFTGISEDTNISIDGLTLGEES